MSETIKSKLPLWVPGNAVGIIHLNASGAACPVDRSGFPLGFYANAVDCEMGNEFNLHPPKRVTLTMVEGGGVCEWRQGKLTGMRTLCGNVFDEIRRGFKYCPYCGLEIREVTP